MPETGGYASRRLYESVGGLPRAVDGWFFPADPSELFEQGRFNAVPLIAGTNTDEAAVFMMMFGHIKTVADYRSWLAGRFGDRAGQIIDAYPAANDSDVPVTIKNLLTELSFVEPTRSVALAVQSRAPVYMYRFTRVNGLGKALKMGAHHGAEIAYPFGTFGTPLIPVSAKAYDDVDFALGKAIRSAWVKFARTGNPNGTGLVEWPRYAPGKEGCMEFGDQPAASQLQGTSRIDLLKKIFEEFEKWAGKADFLKELTSGVLCAAGCGSGASARPGSESTPLPPTP